MSNIRDRFVTTFGEHLAVSIEAAIEKHVPALKIELDRGSNPLQFALIWAVGLECLTRLEFRVEHDITVPWSLLRDWMRAADITKDFDGTFEYGSRGVGRFDEILGPRSEADVEAGWVATEQWLLATAPAGLQGR